MTKEKKGKLIKAGLIGIAVFIILLIVTYVGMAQFFKDHYFYNTIINGNDYSYKTPAETENEIYQSIKDYSLEVAGREGMYDILLPAEIDMDYTFGTFLINVKKAQNPYMWLTGYFSENIYEIDKMAKYNEEELDQKIKGMSFFQVENIRAPSKAYIEYSEERGSYGVTNASPGTEINRKKAAEVIKAALDGLERNVNLEESGCYLREIEAEDITQMEKVAEEANRYILANITYDWNGNEVTVSGNTINQWLDVSEDAVVLKEDEIRNFVAQQSKQYDTYGRDRNFHTTDGRDLTLKSGGYGWKTNRDAESEALIDSVRKGEVLEKEPEYTCVGAQKGKDDIGNTYVEIDLGHQHLYLYIDGAIVLESDFVSGNVSRGWTTPGGVFGLTYKTRNAVLRGDNYETPVSYWMPFNGNIGMHDAGWRKEFGGELYLTGGSHGCVNLPPENAKIIYEYVYTGFPVVCYY